MDEDILFPSYIYRDEEQQIRHEAEQVRADGKSRAILLYGPGGIGKTWLVRELAHASNGDHTTIWVDPIDIDDSEYWLLSNLEREVARQLDPENLYFEPYANYLSRLPSYTRSDIGSETVLSHLGRIKQIFVQCYRRFVEGSGKTVVIVFDTIETIRGMYLEVTLTQWMKALPGTLFILSGRPPPEPDAEDPIKNELEDPHQRLPVRIMRLSEFSQPLALRYLNRSSIAAGLTEEEKQKLVHLARGHPLWLAFTISYLREKGMPEEALKPLDEIERDVPYRGEMTQAGQDLHEGFKRRLVTPYREADFWHEAIKRLAVVRQSVNEVIWQHLMADRPLPDGVTSLDDTWKVLMETPWIRQRANGRFVTLHDAVAEELAQRIIPLHDQDEHWRRELWGRAVNIYVELTDGPEGILNAERAAVDDRLRQLGPTPHQDHDGRPVSEEEETAFVQEVAALDARKRELDQFKAARLFYQLLSDPATGCEQLLDLFSQATQRHDVLFEDLLALEMQRFLPGGSYAHALGDVIGSEIDRFRAWLTSDSPDRYVEIGLTMAQYLIEERPAATLELLDQLETLPAEIADYSQRYRMHILRGNACMRIPGRVRDGLPHFREALAAAQTVTSHAGPMLVARAYKELGFYYRNQGMWREADDAYQKARDAISPTLTVRSLDDDREEMASIQTNWAYVKGLVGKYREGSNLVESAITVRNRLNKRQEEGNSWSVCGEVYRYERRFQKAWEAFAQAEQIFLELRNWAWLGLVYQEQAICLFQATHDGINLIPGRDPTDQAKRLITRALDICRDQSVRVYPSALNRAGRIFGYDDFDAGIGYLAEGIDWARRLSDGWFLLANLIEYVEASYRAWAATGKTAYIDQIWAREPEVTQATEEYEFPDLKGRWNLLRGHLGIRHWKETGDTSALDGALDNYTTGFGLISQGYVGSSGASALPGEFATFARLFDQLPSEIQAEWLDELRREWSTLGEGSTLVLARLEELY
jgi:tetratricopeptide (TPR) repeat protein